MKEEEVKKLLDMSWMLFNCLDDFSYDEDCIEAVYYFVKEHSFDPETLPPNLLKSIEKRMRQEEKERFIDDEIIFDEMKDFINGDF